MSKISLSGAALGTGTFTIASPNGNTDRIINLPDAAGTVAVTGGRPSFVSTIGVGNATPSGSGSGITFPATQSASSDANTLDDYEEGTFTPTLSSTGTPPTVSAYINRSGAYTKVGDLVTVLVSIRATISSIGSGQPTVTGLPFTEYGYLPGISGGLTTIVPNKTYSYIASNVVYSDGSYTTNAQQYFTFTTTYKIA